MWNQIFPQNKSNYYSYSTKRKEELAKYAKYRLLLMLITRSTYRILKDSISQIEDVTNGQNLIIHKMVRIIRKNAQYASEQAFQKLKQNLIISRSKEKTIKNVCVLLERMLKYKLKKTFATISLFGQRKNEAAMQSLENMRKSVFCRKVDKVFQNKKKSYFLQMFSYSRYVKRVIKKVKIAGMIGKQYIKNVKQACFNRLTKNLLPAVKTNNYLGNLKQQNENKELKIKLNDMEVQLQNKNDSISRLETQIQQLKTEQSSNNYNSFSEYTVLTNGLNKSRSIAYQNKNKKGQNQSYDSIDFSLGSILGNSFSLNKSRSKQMRKGDSVVSTDCNCGYKQKYVKYKNSNESLKNQLQIVKEELEVAKDLNDHFTNQIRQYFGGQKDTIELDRLRKQQKQLQRQRDELRMKVTKYQNHINTLKSEFKTKIEELYRKVKKQR